MYTDLHFRSASHFTTQSSNFGLLVLQSISLRLQLIRSVGRECGANCRVMSLDVLSLTRSQPSIPPCSERDIGSPF
uniref:Uncharacterized protein n=1 Tax=Strigamia maritima TaxID=126957 RepID=T1IPU7_STRMM